MFGKVWINNGVVNKVILKTDELPLNWNYGCIKKKQKTSCRDISE